MTATILPPGIQWKSVDTQAQNPHIDDLGNGVIEAIVSITGMKDNVNDVIMPGAYQKSLTQRTPKGVWHHSWTDPIAKTLDIKELMPGDPLLPSTLPDGSPWPSGAGALYVKMEFNLKTDKGKNAYEDVKFFGDSQEWSIGYKVPERKSRTRNGVRFIQELDLYEYSPVLFGAMSSARTTTVKDAQLAYKSAMAGDHNITEGVKMDRMTEIKSAMSQFADAFYHLVGLVGDLSNEGKSEAREEVLDLVEEMDLDPEDFEDFYDDVDAGDLESAQEKALALTNTLEEKGDQSAISVMESIALELKSIEDDEDDTEYEDDEDEEEFDEEEGDTGHKSSSDDTEVKSIPLDEFYKHL